MTFGMWLLFIFSCAVLFEFFYYVRKEYRAYRAEREHERAIEALRPRVDDLSARSYWLNMNRGGGEDYEDLIDNGPVNTNNDK